MPTQDILINPNSSGDPTITFIGSGLNATPITLKVLSNYQSASGSGSAIVFDGSDGRLFSITDNLSSGIIFNVGNSSGLSLLNASAVGDVKIAEFGRFVGVGYGTPLYTLDVFGTGNFRQPVIFNSGVSVTGTLSVNGTGVSVSGHTHTASQITDFNEAVDDRIGSGLFVAGTGIRLFYNDTANSFNVSVSGLINNPTNNRVLTSRDNTSTGIDAETYLVFDGSNFTVGDNTNGGLVSTIAGGQTNSIVGAGFYQFIGGGISNTLGGMGLSCIVGGGNNTVVSGVSAFNFICGGSYQSINGGDRSFIGGGSYNSISGSDSAIVGGGANKISGIYNFIGAGTNNAISSGSTYNVIAGGNANRIISGTYCGILGGSGNNNGGYNNVFILGSSITGTQADTTYVQNLNVNSTGNLNSLKFSTIDVSSLPTSTGLSSSGVVIVVEPTGAVTTYKLTGSGLRSSLLEQPAQLRFRQGTEAERLLITPASGEPIWTTDTQRFYIGDGSTSGGDFIGPGPYTYAGTGYTNIVPIHSTIGYISGTFSNILGGYNNTVSGIYLSISNGQHNTITDTTGTFLAVSGNSTIVNGTGNRIIEGQACIIGGGFRNSISGAIGSIIVGGGDPIWGGNSISGSRNFIGGGIGNVIISGVNSNIVGGGWRGPGALNGNFLQSSFCLIGGGDRNVVSTGSHWSSIIGGYNNTISSGCSFSLVAGGANNNIISVTGLSVVVPGLFAATTTAQTIGGGWSNMASGLYSTIPGGFRAKTTRFGEFAHAAGFFGSIGDAQHTILVARRTTTDNTSNQILYLDGTSYLLTLPAKTTSTFSIKVSAYNDTDSSSAGWIFRGAIKRDGANNTSIVGSVIEENWKDPSMSSAVANVIANDTTESLDILVTGLTSKNIRWVAVIDISQVSYGTP